MEGDDNGFDWQGLSDFIYSVEGPTLGILSVAKGGSVSQGADGSFSATATDSGTFAGPGAAGTGRNGIPAAADVSSAVVASAPLAAVLSRPGAWLLALAGVAVVIAIVKS